MFSDFYFDVVFRFHPVEVRISRYGAWSMIGHQFWEGHPWEGFVPRISINANKIVTASGSPSGELTPPQPRRPVAGPSSVSPTVAVAVGAASVSSPLAAGSMPEDAVSL
ncbi:hypothetical protein Taro_018279 [Colocasia esculenta]|uniref:Uncharacterized protein n=1 Tax=Colocasia esculenta TaxID=4460 RepID=A0A843V1Z4_COLES|nr:hypothetical protein [Colocasia esculenta]